MQSEPDTLGTSHLAGLRRAVCFFAGMAGICAVLGAAAVGIPGLANGERTESSVGTILTPPVETPRFTDLVGADERLFARTLSR